MLYHSASAADSREQLFVSLKFEEKFWNDDKTWKAHEPVIFISVSRYKIQKHSPLLVELQFIDTL